MTQYRDLHLDLDEKHLLEQAVNRIRVARRPLVHIVDIGAATGRWTFYVRERLFGMESRFHLFEPCFEQMVVLRQIYGEHLHVELYPSVVTDRSGMVPFFEEPIPEHSSATPGATVRQRLMSSVSLDDWATTANIDFIDLLKIDAEGLEPQILRGAEQLLDAQRVGMIQFEYGGRWLEPLGPVLDRLRSFGYNVLEFNGTKVALAGIQKEDHVMRNLLAVRQ